MQQVPGDGIEADYIKFTCEAAIGALADKHRLANEVIVVFKPLSGEVFEMI